MKKTATYKRPVISEKKIKLNHFLTYDFFDTLQNSLVSEVYASSHIRTISDGGYDNAYDNNYTGSDNNYKGVVQVPDGCFPAGTPILMADGSTKEIQDIKANDKVSSYSLSDGKMKDEKVSQLLIRTNKSGYVIINGRLTATPNHEIFVNMRHWLRADQIKIGDELLDDNDSRVKVTTIEKVANVGTVYNLTLEGKNHNFFAERLLVHNQNGCGAPGGY